MKTKIYFILLIIIFLATVYIYKQQSDLHKVFRFVSPIEIYIDSNRNLIFDEQTTFKIENIYYVNENLDTKKFPIFKNLTQDEILLLEYLAIDYSKKLIKNKYIKIKNNKLYLKNNEYKSLLLNSNLYFDTDIETQKNVLKTIQFVNADNYIFFNPQTKHYHKIGCKHAQTEDNINLTTKEKIQNNWIKCKYCYKNDIEEESTYKSLQKSFEKDKIKIFFFDLNGVFIPNNKCNSIGCSSLIKEIENAKNSIDFAIYGINNQPQIIEALVKAKNRGIKIRWVCDYSEKYGNYYPDTLELQRKIQTFNSDKQYEENNPSAIMHNKFFIFDKQRVWTGSANITSTDLSEFNTNYAVLIDSKDIANIYTNEFEQMFNGKFHKYKSKVNKETLQISKDTKLEILFSPKDNIVENKIIPLIKNSKKYIYIPMFFITHKGVESALINAHNRGIEIKLINDATNARSKHTVLQNLRQAGINAKTENYAGKMHSKTLIIDDEISVIGSLNYTKSGNNKNDENIVVIYNKDITQYLKSTFLYLWNKIPSKYLKYNPMAESIESIGSCFDNIDNDFDDKIDMKDSSCLYK